MLTENIIENYHQIRSQIPTGIELIAVSKNHPAEAIQEIYRQGQRVFGENKVQELVEKASKLPPDIQWHLIGHLQSNKVKLIAPFVDTIQSVDSENILEKIDTEAIKNHRKINVLLQIKIAKEDSKTGLTFEEADKIVDLFLAKNYPNVELIGLMGMATFTENKTQIKEEFDSLKSFYDTLSAKLPLRTLSMGMSDDFLLAIESGANSVRIGSSIFGSR